MELLSSIVAMVARHGTVLTVMRMEPMIAQYVLSLMKIIPWMTVTQRVMSARLGLMRVKSAVRSATWTSQCLIQSPITSRCFSYSTPYSSLEP